MPQLSSVLCVVWKKRAAELRKNELTTCNAQFLLIHHWVLFYFRPVFSKRTSTTTANTEQKQAAVSRNETKRTKANEGGERERAKAEKRTRNEANIYVAIYVEADRVDVDESGLRVYLGYKAKHFSDCEREWEPSSKKRLCAGFVQFSYTSRTLSHKAKAGYDGTQFWCVFLFFLFFPLRCYIPSNRAHGTAHRSRCGWKFSLSYIFASSLVVALLYVRQH